MDRKNYNYVNKHDNQEMLRASPKKWKNFKRSNVIEDKIEFQSKVNFIVIA